MYQPISRTEPKARKRYRCWLCGTAIDAGETHVKTVGAMDGELQTVRAHYSCDEHTKKWRLEDYESHNEGEFRVAHNVEFQNIRREAK